METGFTPYLKNSIMNFFFGGDNDGSVSAKMPCPLYVGLFVEQDAAIGPVELIIGSCGYERAPVTFGMLAQNGTIKNTEPVTFNKADGSDWASGMEKLTHIGIFTSHKEGEDTNYVSDENDTMIAFLPLASEEQVHEGETFQLNPEAIKIQLI